MKRPSTLRMPARVSAPMYSSKVSTIGLSSACRITLPLSMPPCTDPVIMTRSWYLWSTPSLFRAEMAVSSFKLEAGTISSWSCHCKTGVLLLRSHTLTAMSVVSSRVGEAMKRSSLSSMTESASWVGAVSLVLETVSSGSSTYASAQYLCKVLAGHHIIHVPRARAMHQSTTFTQSFSLLFFFFFLAISPAKLRLSERNVKFI